MSCVEVIDVEIREVTSLGEQGGGGGGKCCVFYVKH
jgi:hypothetical protein